MTRVQVEVLLPEGDYGEEVDLDSLQIGIDDFEPTSTGAVPVRHCRQGAVAAVEGTSADPHQLARNPKVMSVWADDRPLWDTPVPEDDPSRYAL